MNFYSEVESYIDKIFADLCPKFGVENVSVGEEIISTEDIGWIKIKNPDGISNVNVFFSFGDLAVCHPGKLTIIAKDGNKALVKYTSDKPSPGGTLCPTGAIFWLPLSKIIRIKRFNELSKARNGGIVSQKDIERSKMRGLLKKLGVN